jgi:hypothetical protein
MMALPARASILDLRARCVGPLRRLLCRCRRCDRRALQSLARAQQQPEHVLLGRWPWAEQAVAVQVDVALAEALQRRVQPAGLCELAQPVGYRSQGAVAGVEDACQRLSAGLVEACGGIAQQAAKGPLARSVVIAAVVLGADLAAVPGQPLSGVEPERVQQRVDAEDGQCGTVYCREAVAGEVQQLDDRQAVGAEQRLRDVDRGQPAVAFDLAFVGVKADPPARAVGNQLAGPCADSGSRSARSRSGAPAKRRRRCGSGSE